MRHVESSLPLHGQCRDLRSAAQQWLRLGGSHARVVLGWRALRPRAVSCGHFPAARSTPAPCLIEPIQSL